ncbi:amino acid adenylation domain-containing protein [Streptomyces cinerochromogenes]|uniref:Amino acid adenylation domain-containing protein n=1 Tax=Streptomyces cinerochromogenes TaxID=66422 RepID=A0ABW7B9A5_9ACTN
MGLSRATKNSNLDPLPLYPGAVAAMADATLTGPPEAPMPSSVFSAVVELAAAHPDRLAITDATEQFSYLGLVGLVRDLRAALLDWGWGAGDRLAVLLRRSGATVVAFLAAESIGATYIPLDPNSPPERLAEVLEASGSSALLTGFDCTALGYRIGARVGTKVFEMPGPLPRDGSQRTAELSCSDARQADPDEARYLIYTSGSTGRPKAVAISHRGLLNHLSSMIATLGITAADSVAFSAAPTYVISVWQMLAPLLVGARVTVIEDNDLRFPRRLVRRVADAQVTVLELVPSVIRWLTAVAGRDPDSGPQSALRRLISTGEPLFPQLAAEASAAFPGVEIFNAYGCSECSDDVTLHQVMPGDLSAARVPIGRPLPGVKLYLLVKENGRWRAAAPGEPGELWVGGAGVSLGYPDEPELTRTVFFRDPFDPNSPTGRLYRTGDLAVFSEGRADCLGRADRQVKIAGMRVELDEIECVIGSLPGVTGCAVVVDNERGRNELRAYVVTSIGCTNADLYTAACKRLPPGLVPRRWVQVGSLPTTRTGKVDRRQLS